MRIYLFDFPTPPKIKAMSIVVLIGLLMLLNSRLDLRHIDTRFQSVICPSESIRSADRPS